MHPFRIGLAGLLASILLLGCGKTATTPAGTPAPPPQQALQVSCTWKIGGDAFPIRLVLPAGTPVQTLESKGPWMRCTATPDPGSPGLWALDLETESRTPGTERKLRTRLLMKPGEEVLAGGSDEYSVTVRIDLSGGPS